MSTETKQLLKKLETFQWTIDDNTIDKQKELYPKFRNRKGKMTAYAFACGYIQRFSIDRNNNVCLMHEGGTGFSVKGFCNGERFWDSCNLDVGRKLFDLRKQQILAGVKIKILTEGE